MSDGGQGAGYREGQPEQLEAMALTHRLFSPGSEARGTNEDARGRKHEAFVQGANEVLASLPHLLYHPVHPPICSQKNRQWVTKCCLSYLMLLITMAVQSQLSPQKQNIFIQHSKWVLFHLGQRQIEHCGLVQAKGALLGVQFSKTHLLSCFFLLILIVSVQMLQSLKIQEAQLG